MKQLQPLIRAAKHKPAIVLVIGITRQISKPVEFKKRLVPEGYRHFAVHVRHDQMNRSTRL
jgi:hypothetical protein